MRHLLLRIVGTAGAGALVSIAACGSNSGPEESTALLGSVAQADGGSGGR